MAGVKISQLQDGGALQPTDAFPVARGSFTRKILGAQLLDPIQSLNTRLNALSADVSTVVRNASAINVVDSPTIDLDWNASTRTLSSSVINSSIANAKIAFDGGSFAFRNKIINGDMRIDQRNSGSLVAGVNATQIFGPDRFFGFANNVGQSFTVRQLSADGPSNFNNYFRFNTTTGNAFTTTDQSSIQQRIEGFNAVDLRWGTAAAKTITVSFWVRTSIAGTYLFSVNARSPFARNYTTTYTVSVANTWEFKTITIPGDTTIGSNWVGDNNTYMNMSWSMGTGPDWFASNGSNNSWVGVNLANTSLSAHVQIGANTGATFDLTGVQLEVGPTATPFEHRPIGTELALCQRYYEETQQFIRWQGTSYVGNWFASQGGFLVRKRASPTITLVDAVGQSGYFPVPTLESANVDGYSARSFAAASAGPVSWRTRAIANAEL
jgi:hypothetical protein